MAHSLRADGFDASEDGTGRGTPIVAFDCKASGRSGFGVGDIASTSTAMGHSGSHQNGGGQQAVAFGSAVRRLTPRECERLQGFPDDYTAITYRKKSSADGPRYKALGNSMAVPVVRWILSRIEHLETHVIPDDYDLQKDLAGSIREGFEAIRARVAAGGPGWERNSV